MKYRETLAGAAALLLAGLLVAGCSPNVEATKTSNEKVAKTKPENVSILMTRPDRKFVELGTVSTAGWKQEETAKMHGALKDKGADLGADAVLITSSGMTPDGDKMKMWVQGVAIKYQ